MRYKKILFFGLIIIISPVWALEWEPVKIIRTIDTEHVLLTDGRVVRFIGFDGPDHLFPSVKERGTARQTYQLLKRIFETQSIKILPDTILKEDNMYPRHIKLENGENLVELLLQKGLGSFLSDEKNMHFDTKFARAEQSAKQNKVGIWGRSMFQETIYRMIKTAGVMTKKWKKKFAHLLAPISIGRVREVKSGNRIILEGGACIRLLGVETPSPNDTRLGHRCFGEQSQAYLTSLVLGKKVELTQDLSQLDDDRCILRHMWLQNDANTMGPPRHINKEMIDKGFGKASFNTIDIKFKKELLAIQETVYKNPRGAWLACAVQVLTPPKPVQPLFDESCPIKISKSGKIHTPKSSWYKRLSPIKCFQNEEEALEAGFEM